MRRRRSGLLGALLVCAAAAHALPAHAESDAERLSVPLAEGFRRPQVAIYPLVDLRPLPDPRPAESAPPPAAWTALVQALEGYDNLELVPPARTRGRLAQAAFYPERLGLAREQARLGYAAYRALRPGEAAERLGSAVRIFLELEHQFVDPREVARAEMYRGIALLESEDPSAFERFRDALLLDPTLRPDPDLHREATVAAFEQARARLAEEPAPTPPGWLKPNAALPQTLIRIRVRATRDALHVVVQQPGQLQPDRAEFGTDPGAAGSMLASRIHACLPFGDVQRRGPHRTRWFADAGFHYFLFLDSRIAGIADGGLFPNFGAVARVGWHFAPNIHLVGTLALTNSGRDFSEDLRRDVAAVRATIAPGYIHVGRNWRGWANVGFEGMSLSELVITSEPACKVFDDPDADPQPPDGHGCNPTTDIDRVPRSWLIGATAAGGLGLRLVDQVWLSGQLTVSTYFFETEDVALDLPLGIDLGLGYRF